MVATALFAAACSADSLPGPGRTTPAALARVSGDGQSGPVTQPLADPLVVIVTDSGGAGVPGIPVTWTVVAGGGSLSATSATTDASGQASVSLTLGPVAGPNIVSAGVTGLGAVTFAASATAPGSASLSFSVQPANVTAGTGINPSVQVTVRDSLGNVATGSTASVTLALTGGAGTAGAHLRGTTTVSAAGGVATFAGLSVDSAGNGYRLTATASGLAGATSSTFNVTAAPAVKLGFSVQPSNAAPNAAISPAVKVAVRDSLGNVVTSSTASVTVALTGGTGTAGAHLGGTKTVRALSGVATFSTLSVDLAGTGYSLTASASGLTTAISATFNVVAASSNKLGFSVQPTNATAGAAISPAVKVAVRDSLGNVVTGSTASITVALSGAGTSGAHLRGTTTVSAVSGVATFSTLSVDSAGTGYTLTATATGLTGATSAAFNVAAAPAARLAFSIQPSSATAGVAIAPAVKVAVRDSLGNAVTGSTAGITVALSGGTGTSGAHLRGTATVSATSGVATFSTLSVDSSGSGYKLAATAGGLAGATSSTFNVTAAPAVKLGFSVQPSNAAPNAAISPAVKVAVRDSLGNVVTSSTASVTVALTGGTGTAGAHLGGTTTISAASGVATFSTLTVDSVGTGYTLTASASGLASATSAAFAVSAAAGGTYTTNFPLAENPISEGGKWINGGSVGLDWTDVVTTPGFAYGTEVNGNYTDATAILTGTWPVNQYAQATVYWNPSGSEPVPEVELRLRSAISAHVNRGYEITFGGGYLIIVRWNGGLGNFNYLVNASGSQYTPKTGDVIKATIVGNTISAYKNGVLMGQVTDATWTDGAPGMGFNSGTKGGTYDNTYGFTSFTAGPM
jgi:hypothetical protein